MQKLCGRLIGKNGTFVNMLKARTGAHVIIRLHPAKSSVKICSVDGEWPGSGAGRERGTAVWLSGGWCILASRSWLRIEHDSTDAYLNVIFIMFRK